eukprot:6198028-Pleurochrysis_carterae.AAC.2
MRRQYSKDIMATRLAVTESVLERKLQTARLGLAIKPNTSRIGQRQIRRIAYIYTQSELSSLRVSLCGVAPMQSSSAVERSTLQRCTEGSQGRSQLLIFHRSYPCRCHFGHDPEIHATGCLPWCRFRTFVHSYDEAFTLFPTGNRPYRYFLLSNMVLYYGCMPETLQHARRYNAAGQNCP